MYSIVATNPTQVSSGLKWAHFLVDFDRVIIYENDSKIQSNKKKSMRHCSCPYCISHASNIGNGAEILLEISKNWVAYIRRTFNIITLQFSIFCLR